MRSINPNRITLDDLKACLESGDGPQSRYFKDPVYGGIVKGTKGAEMARTILRRRRQATLLPSSGLIVLVKTAFFCIVLIGTVLCGVFYNRLFPDVPVDALFASMVMLFPCAIAAGRFIPCWQKLRRRKYQRRATIAWDEFVAGMHLPLACDDAVAQAIRAALESTYRMPTDRSQPNDQLVHYSRDLLEYRFAFEVVIAALDRLRKPWVDADIDRAGNAVTPRTKSVEDLILALRPLLAQVYHRS